MATKKSLGVKTTKHKCFREDKRYVKNKKLKLNVDHTGRLIQTSRAVISLQILLLIFFGLPIFRLKHYPSTSRNPSEAWMYGEMWKTFFSLHIMTDFYQKQLTYLQHVRIIVKIASLNKSRSRWRVSISRFYRFGYTRRTVAKTIEKISSCYILEIVHCFLKLRQAHLTSNTTVLHTRALFPCYQTATYAILKFPCRGPTFNLCLMCLVRLAAFWNE